MQPKDMKQQPYVRLEKLCIGYRTGRHGQRTVASGIDATLPAGQLTCLIGRNGTGKSTLLRTVASLQPRLGGRIYIDGTDSATLSQKEMARCGSAHQRQRDQGHSAYGTAEHHKHGCGAARVTRTRAIHRNVGNAEGQRPEGGAACSQTDGHKRHSPTHRHHPERRTATEGDGGESADPQSRIVGQAESTFKKTRTGHHA